MTEKSLKQYIDAVDTVCMNCLYEEPECSRCPVRESLDVAQIRWEYVKRRRDTSATANDAEQLPYASVEDILTEKITTAPVREIEDFLGYQVTADILESIDSRVRAVLDGMTEEELLDCEKHFLK